MHALRQKGVNIYKPSIIKVSNAATNELAIKMRLIVFPFRISGESLLKQQQSLRSNLQTP